MGSPAAGFRPLPGFALRCSFRPHFFSKKVFDFALHRNVM
jgi:hypothetical protein